ncbi:glycosyltransferase family 4 protein [Patulibacter minatonensis]|uniref:glycosyltransferase family 4 protein n=1 Tax=Patulibacter minatonensis TaxID=298163 RepID=UPI00146FA39E
MVTLRAAFDARDAFRADLRGWGRYAADLLGALARRDDVRVVPYAGGGRLPEIAWEQVGWPARLWARGAGRPDLLHAPNCFLPLVRPCPGVVTVHDLAFETHPDDFAPRTGWKYRTFTRRAVLSAEAVICVSRATADDVLERYGADPGRVHVVPNGPSLPLTTEATTAAVDPAVPVSVAGRSAAAGAPGEDPDRPYLLAIGDLRAKKNLERLADAWRLSGLPHRLVIVGAGGTHPADTPEGRLAHGLRARGAELPGYLPDAELDALLRGATALVHPSLFEGFGLVVLEAMVRGIPVACSDIPSLRETAGGASALFDPLDVEDLARGLHDVVDRGAAYGPAGRTRASGFSWDRAAEETAAVYRFVLS